MSNESPSNSGQSYHVLVVDDYELIHKTIIGFFKRLNCRVRPAENGQEAFDLFKKNDFDIIFTDISMPIMDGLELAKHIRLHEKKLNVQKNIPIVALTVSRPDLLDDDCSHSGINEILEKPPSINQLKVCLEKWVD